ncbi:ZIP family metal transporter [Bacteriovorax sp. Seq25_V]|uniref:ZIP family metal transporter n=1 Tax=Bacteriovorax sp. Seq25_V TaxID=1201288 RepID=UPI00038A4EF2|nr:ZIP family metal transporter [Bacteriovorax sp. Seq25_V]EQC43949.1 metal cation transporter, ZIP domain protein [Bacteriovorax sp. Seq25_V]
MSFLDNPFIIVTLIGLSTGLGALPVFFKKKFDKDSLDLGMGFSAGIMLVASFISLIIPGIESGILLFGKVNGLLTVTFGIVIGYFFIIGIHNLTPHLHFHKAVDMKLEKNLSRMTLIMLAICLHNIPEGLTVGVGLASDDKSQGLALSFGIALQNMPEGLVVAIGLISEGSSKSRAFQFALLSGLVEPIAAILGYYSLQFSNMLLPFSLGFAGGAMLFVICQEIFPELFRKGHEKKASCGVVSGIITMFALSYLL